MKDTEHVEWLDRAIEHLKLRSEGGTAAQFGVLIHEALEICEAEKYATPESRFTFTFTGASEEDVALIRGQLTPFENSIVEIETR